MHSKKRIVQRFFSVIQHVFLCILFASLVGTGVFAKDSRIRADINDFARSEGHTKGTEKSFKAFFQLALSSDPTAQYVLIGFDMFDYDSAQLSVEAKDELSHFASQLRDILGDLGPSAPNIRIEGHTDSVGRAQYNLQLSMRRALSVADFLIGKGIPETNLTTVAFGEQRPLPDVSPSKAKQRRIEFAIIRSRR